MKRLMAGVAVAAGLVVTMNCDGRDVAIYNGKLVNALNANGQAITNVATPVADGDVATKAYVDTHGGGGSVDYSVVTNIAEAVMAPATNAIATDVSRLASDKRDLTNNVAMADSFAYSAWSKENLPSGVTWDDQPFMADDGLWTWHYVDGSSEGYSQGEQGEDDNDIFQTFGYGEGFTSTRTKIAVAISNDVYTTYAFVTNAVAHASGGLTTNDVDAIIASSNLASVTYANSTFLKLEGGTIDGILEQGSNVSANGLYSHAEGFFTTVDGEASHAEGEYASADGNYAHAEGSHTVASGLGSHAEGDSSMANGDFSHAEGCSVSANDDYSFAWNGDYSFYSYSSHGDGTFNINPVGGLAGFYIGETPLSQQIPSSSTVSALVTTSATHAATIAGWESYWSGVTNVTYDFNFGTNFTKRLFETLTNVIDRMGGKVTNPPAFN